MTDQPLMLLGFGTLVSALSAATGMGVRRLLTKTDGLDKKVDAHAERLAAMEVRLPNGEWRELKDSVAGVHGTVREIQTDLSELKIDVHEHAATEKDRIRTAVSESYLECLKKQTRSTKRGKR